MRCSRFALADVFEIRLRIHIVCDTRRYQRANAGTPQTVSVGASFSLDGTGTTYLGTGTLMYQWIGDAGSPGLTGGTTLTPSGVASTCGNFTYTLIVTEPCGLTDTATVALNILADGPYVSNTNCDGALECGSIANP